MDCIFCKIVNGTIPACKVYEDDKVVSFLDISQTTKGHTLIIPKVHKENIFELDAELTAHIYQVAPKIAKALKETFGFEGLNIVNNNGEVAGQTVFHYHVHLIPRYGKNDGFAPTWKNNGPDYTIEQLQAMAKNIQDNIVTE
ncbi:MAG: HIT family protein [Bacillaceae bacterium]